MKKRLLLTLVCLAVLGLFAKVSAIAQQSPAQNSEPSAQSTSSTDADVVTHPNETRFLQHLVQDQKNIWTSPFRLKPNDATWLVPVAGITTGLLVSDPQSSYAMRLGNLSAWKTASNAGLVSAVGMTGAAYIWGHITHDERARETGVLAT